jgi:hypothetical protein
MKFESAIALGNSLPGAYFFTPESVTEFRAEAEDYERAAMEFEQYGCEATLWDALRNLGLNYDEIEWHVANRGKRMARGYV